MQTNQSTITKLAMTSRHLYERGFSVLAVVMMILAFVCSGLMQAKDQNGKSEHDHLNTLAALPAVSAEISAWHEAETAWLSQKATEMTKDLKDHGFQQAKVYSRIKSYDSAREKAMRKNLAIHELNDLFGMRIVVANELDVYRCLNRICERFEIIPGSLKNYIIAPKASGYQSVHVVTQVDDLHRIEFQIRTEHMHQQAEAEHEAYKARVRVA